MSRTSRLLYIALLCFSLGFALFSMQQARAASFNWNKVWLVGLAMLFLGWVLTKAPQFLSALEKKYPQNIRQFPTQSILLYGGILVGVLAIPAASNQRLQPWPILLIWAASILLFLTGAASQEAEKESERYTRRAWVWVREGYLELIIVLVLTILALVLRATALDSIPHNIHGDEGEMGLVARAVIQGDLRDPFATSFLSHANLWFFVQALALRMFGNDIAGLRMLSAVLGALTIPALYFFARPLFGRSTALISAALLTVYHFHLHYSRIGLNNIADPLMMVLTLAALWYGVHKHSRLGFALAGVFMGLAQYFYFSTRLIPIVVLTFLIYLVIMNRHQFMEITGHTVIMLVGFFLSAGLLFRWYVTHPGVYAGRLLEHGLLQKNNYLKLQENGQSLFAALANHASTAFGYFFAIPESSPFHNAGIPLLDHGMDVLFLLSFVLLFLNLKKPGYMLLLLWVGGTALFGGFLLWGFPQSTRYVIAAPALCILMALALVKIRDLLSQYATLPQKLSNGVITLAVLALMAWNVHFYFNVYTPQNRYASTQALTEIAYYLSPQQGKRYVYMFTPPYFYLHHGTIRFVARDPVGLNIDQPITEINSLPAPPPGLVPLFIFVPDRLNELSIVQQRYPDGQLKEYLNQPWKDHAILYIYEPSP